MVNRHRGEIEAIFDGRPHRLCLTLGALAELEAAFGEADMLALAQRFESGRLRAGDAVRVIGAGLRGGGHDIDDDAVGRLTCERGAAGFVAVVAALLQATFGTAETEAAAPPRQRASREGDAPAPFPGRR